MQMWIEVHEHTYTHVCTRTSHASSISMRFIQAAKILFKYIQILHRRESSDQKIPGNTHYIILFTISLTIRNNIFVSLYVRSFRERAIRFYGKWLTFPFHRAIIKMTRCKRSYVTTRYSRKILRDRLCAYTRNEGIGTRLFCSIIINASSKSRTYVVEKFFHAGVARGTP